MKLITRIKNAVAAFRSSVSLMDPELAQWLGIESKDNKKMAEVTYFTCMKMLAETMGKLPWKYYQDAENGKIRADPDKKTRLLTTRPNHLMTPSTFWTTVELNCQHYGNGYVWMRTVFNKTGRYGGEYSIKDLWVLPSNDVTVLMDDAGVFAEKGKLYYQYNDAKTGEMYVFPQENIMHFKTWYSKDGIMGEPVKNIIGSVIDGANSSQMFMSNLYENGLTASMALQYTEEVDGKRIEKLQKKYSKYLTGPKNAGKIVPVPVGLTLIPLRMNLTDAQFFELRKYSALQIAAAFGIKPNQINNYEKSSYANSEMQQLDFLVATIQPRIKMYEEEVNSKFLSQQEVKKNFYYKMNEKAMLRTDSKTQMMIITDAVKNGLYTINEGREYLDKPKVPGGDVNMVNGTYQPITSIGAAYGVAPAQTGGE